MTSTELAVREPSLDVDEMARIAKMLVVSGYFETDHDQAKAIAQMATKILAGAELGFGPWASVTGIHVIQGKPVLGANLMAAAVKANPRYDYRVKQADETGVTLEFFERVDGKLTSLGVSSFTTKDAADAGLANNSNWKKFFRNMAFARAMSNGVRWFAPDVFSGAVVYSGDELGPLVDGETGEILRPGPGSGPQPNPEVPFAQPEPNEADTPDPLRVSLDELGEAVHGKLWKRKRAEYALRISEGRTDNPFDLKDDEVVRINAGFTTFLAKRQTPAQEPIHG
jgi:hypothetical protein